MPVACIGAFHELAAAIARLYGAALFAPLSRQGMAAMTAYACLTRQRIDLGDYAIRSIQPQDIEDIRLWRNAQMDVLRQDALITPDMQSTYFDTQIWPTLGEANPRQILVAFLHREARIGYGGLVHMAWPHSRAEVSFLVAPEIAADDERYPQAFDAFFALIKTLAFDDLGLNRLTTETYSSRTKHISRYAAQALSKRADCASMSKSTGPISTACCTAA
ncbi:MAG: GNAT family N-acetyltransferase [Phenylobacterium zucineum]|nr:MAG: GNAT family N-acetyltransferase [Phenylobacterium zucineum]